MSCTKGEVSRHMRCQYPPCRGVVVYVIPEADRLRIMQIVYLLQPVGIPMVSLMLEEIVQGTAGRDHLWGEGVMELAFLL